MVGVREEESLRACPYDFVDVHSDGIDHSYEAQDVPPQIIRKLSKKTNFLSTPVRSPYGLNR